MNMKTLLDDGMDDHDLDHHHHHHQLVHITIAIVYLTM